MNKMKIEIDSKLCNVAAVRVALTSFISNIQLSVDELMDIKTAVSEAVTNSIEHGYNLEDDKKVSIESTIETIDEMDFVSIKVTDEGVGIEDIELATTPSYTTKPEYEHAGMGFTIMETFMDEVVIDSEVNKGTVITLIKKLRTRKNK